MNKTISELNQITSLATNDILPILDISETDNTLKNKKVSVQQILDLVPGGYISPQRVLEVAKANRQFTNLQDAINEYRIKNLGSTGLVIVHPGNYDVSNTIQLGSSEDINIYFHPGVVINNIGTDTLIKIGNGLTPQ